MKAIPNMTPETRTDHIQHALQMQYGYTRDQAQALLALHLADKLHEVDEQVRQDRDDNPYRLPVFKRIWREGAQRVQQVLFIRELRLRAKAQYHMRDAFSSTPTRI